jgi:hypothetical protein
MPPGPGGIINAVINIYPGNSSRTINTAVIVVRKACRRPSRPQLGGRQQTQQLRIQ